LAVEKPFGFDLRSARELNARILKWAGERQIFRVDHFLGKEPVQGIMPLRFDNGIFEPMWTREHIDSLLSITAMEAPASFEAEAVRDEKVRVLGAIRPVAPGDAVRGQYGAGAVDGAPVKAYRDELRVSPESHTETYAALKVTIDNPRWEGVPFYLRTGKRLARHLTTIAIVFRKGNVLTLVIAPDQGFTTTFKAKEPGLVMLTGDAYAGFAYRDFFQEPPTVGYETLPYHAMTGNQLLFQREDRIDASWAAVQPVLDKWNASRDEMPPYRPGSDGPDAAAALVERDGRRWLPLQ
jgi:glucose-6-phosphate 1-dehydrogenase